MMIANIATLLSAEVIDLENKVYGLVTITFPKRPLHEKTCLRGFRPGPTKAGL